MALSPPNVIIGAWMAPIQHFATWKARGVNVLVGAEGGPFAIDRAAWRKAARDVGLLYMDWPDADPAFDANDDHLIALMQPDEPNSQGVSVESLKSNYTVLKGRGKPIYLGLDLWKMQWRDYPYDVAVQCCDWLGGDYYPANRGSDIAEFAKRIDDLKSIAGGKRTILAIETSNQLLNKQLVNGVPWAPNGRGPTVHEWMAQVMLARSKGCDLFYFPDVIGLNWEAWDGTPEDIAAAMPNVAAAIMPPPPVNPAALPDLIADFSAKGYVPVRATLKPATR